jgi:hypothetical protein
MVARAIADHTPNWLNAVARDVWLWPCGQANPRWEDQMSQRRALFRLRFIAECAEHLSDADAIADLTERPDDYFQSLWLESLLANRLGHRPPHPWFIEFCLRDITRDADDLVRGSPVGG